MYIYISTYTCVRLAAFLITILTMSAHITHRANSPDEMSYDAETPPATSKLYIYTGEGAGEASKQHLMWALSTYTPSDIYTVQYITPQQIIEGSWRSDASLIALPGGYDCGYVKMLGEEGTAVIRQYIEDGGAYLGMCAGGYFGADRIVFDEGGPLEVVGVRELKFFQGVCEGPVFEGFEYGTERGAHASFLRWNLSTEEDNMEDDYDHVFIYFNGGGKFIPDTHRTHDRHHGAGFAYVMRNRLRGVNDPSGCGLNVTGDTHRSAHSDTHRSTHSDTHGSTHSDTHRSTQSDIHRSTHRSTENDSGADRSARDVDEAEVEQNDVTTEEEVQDMLRAAPAPPETPYTTAGNCEILARYLEKPEHPPAIVKCRVGQGVAILTGVHFEWNVDAMNATNPYLEDVIPKLKYSQPKQAKWMHSVLSHLGITSTVPFG